MPPQVDPRKILKKIEDAIAEKGYESRLLDDYFSTARLIYAKDKDRGPILKLRGMLMHQTKKYVQEANVPMVKTFSEITKKTYLLTAKDNFEDYMIALEWDRPPQERFYLPRRKVVKNGVEVDGLITVVNAIQRLLDNELDELYLSQPARTGKTTILLYFMTMLIGRNAESSNLYSAYSDYITSAFYSGVNEILSDPTTYNWGEIFPGVSVAATNAKEETLDIGRHRRYSSLTCRSLYGTLNGACDCNGYLVADDLIGGIEEAMNRDRLIAANAKVQNNLLPRVKQKAKIIWMGTRWSLIDPIGVRVEMVQNSEAFSKRRIEIINTPALDENDESNFNYKFNVGFDTDHYRMQRAMFERNNDMASWFAQYQGQPIERSGALFSPEEMHFYNGTLPEGVPDRIICAVDPAWGGGDACAAPIGVQYGDSVYIPDVLYSFEDKRRTQPALVSKIMEHNVAAVQFECTKATDAYMTDIDRMLREKGLKLNITSRAAPSNKHKEDRILDKAPEIREMYFLEEGKRSKEYSLFMQNIYSFKFLAKNAHDDAPDSAAMLADMIHGRQYGTVEILKRKYF